MSFKNIILTLSFIIPFHTHTMDKSIDLEQNEAPQECIFYLAKLPGDIWDLIAQYLIFDIESEEEFITRTKTTTRKKINLENFSKYLTPWKWGKGCNPLIYGYCPHEMNIALLDEDNETNLKIINIKKNQLIHTQQLGKKQYKHIVLSRNATMFATIHEHREQDHTTGRFDEIGHIITNYLTIKNIATQKTATIEIPGGFSFYSINFSVPLAFNKQGTHLILHGTDSTKKLSFFDHLQKSIQKDPMPHHLIFPVTINMDTPENGIITEDMIKARNILASQKTLQHYFEQKGICKNIASSTNK